MLPPQVREVADSHADDLAALATEATGLVAGIANQARSPERWRDAVARIGTDLLMLQVAAVSLSEGYVTDLIDTAGGDPAAEAEVDPNAWEDFTDGGGSWLLNMVYAVNAQPRAGVSGDVLTRRVEDLATSIVLSGIYDAERSATQTTSLTRPWSSSYVRMLRGKSCARCAILAGRRYKAQTAFRRHHHCDCVHIPAAEDSGGWSSNTRSYFRSLTREDQDRIFTTAGAQAIRDGSDPAQVVNARQGITTVTAYGRQLQVTTEGTSRRGSYGGYEVGPGGELTVRQGPAPPRLLPDEIYLLAEEFGWDRAETLRQLRRFRYVL